MHDMNKQDIRNKIDEIDAQMASLLLERLELCGEIAKIKAQNGLPVYDAAREKEVLANAVKNGGEMSEYTHSMQCVIIGLCKRFQNEQMQSADLNQTDLT